MTDQEIIDFADGILGGLHSHRMQLDEQARIALIYEKKFKPALLRILEECRLMERAMLCKTDIFDEPNNLDIRVYMSDELIDLASEKGFIYVPNHSTPDFLDFHKIETESSTTK